MPDNKGGGGKPPIDYSNIGKGDKLENFIDEKGNPQYEEAAKRQNKRTNKVNVKPVKTSLDAVIKQQEKSFKARDERNTNKPYENQFNAPKEKTPEPEKNQGRSGRGGRGGGGGFFNPVKQFKDKSKQWIKDLLSENELEKSPVFSVQEKAELLDFMKEKKEKIRTPKKFEERLPFTEQEKKEILLAMIEMEDDKPAFLDKLDIETPTVDIDAPDMDMGDGDGE